MSNLDLARRHLLGLGLGTGALLAAAGCGSRGPRITTRQAAALAPIGWLRVCINLGNPVLARRAAPGAPVSGVSVDLAQALAARLGVEALLRVVDSAPQAVALVRAGEVDLGFFAIDPQRAEGISFSAPYLLIEGSYLVRHDSPLSDNEQVDRPGMRVVVGRGSSHDLHLARALRQAQLLHAPSAPAVVEHFLAEGADVAAGLRQQLQAEAARRPGLRLLPGRFVLVEQAMGLPARHGDAAATALRLFVEQAKASGLVAQALARHGVQGAVVAPAAA